MIYKLSKLAALLSLCALILSSAATANDRAAIIASCKARLNLPPNGCNCIADKAAKDFNKQQYAFFMSIISGNKAKSAQLRRTMSVTDLTQVASRMTKMPTECARGQ